jgi:hypothetical protein
MGLLQTAPGLAVVRAARLAPTRHRCALAGLHVAHAPAAMAARPARSLGRRRAPPPLWLAGRVAAAPLPFADHQSRRREAPTFLFFIFEKYWPNIF